MNASQLGEVLARGRRVSFMSLLVLASLGVGCSKESKPAAEQPAAEARAEPGHAPVVASAAAATTAAAGDPAGAQANPNPTATDKVDDAKFSLQLSPEGAYEKGKPAKASLVLVAKSPFHVNDQYPYKFKLKKTPGLKYASDVVGKDAMQLEKKRAVMTVAFTPQASGKETLAGRFSFSVCAKDRCLIEKQDLALDLDVK